MHFKLIEDYDFFLQLIDIKIELIIILLAGRRGYFERGYLPDETIRPDIRVR